MSRSSFPGKCARSIVKEHEKIIEDIIVIQEQPAIHICMVSPLSGQRSWIISADSPLHLLIYSAVENR